MINDEIMQLSRISRRSVIAGVAGALALGGSTRLASAQGLKSLTLSYPPVMPFSNAIIAGQAGFFKTAGLDVKRKTLPSTDILRAALVSGEVEVVAMSIDTIARGHAAGFDWKILYPADIYDSTRPDTVLMARSDLTVNSAKDLEGRTVAAAAGAISETALRGWMAENGGDPATLKIVDVPFTQIIGALESKSIDAAHIVEPFMTIALDKGIGKTAAKHLDAVSKRFLISAYVAKQSWIDANQDTAKHFVEGMAAATNHILTQPEAVRPILSKETRIPDALLERIFPKHYVISTSIRPEEIQSGIDFLVKHKQIERSFSYKDLVSSYMPISA